MDDHQPSEKLGLSDDALAVQPTVFAPDVLKDHPQPVRIGHHGCAGNYPAFPAQLTCSPRLRIPFVTVAKRISD
jgi:hypothetical protein